MGFEDLGDWADIAGLKLPIGGKVYALPPISSELGLRIIAIMEFGSDLAYGRDPNVGDTDVLSDADERALYRDVLGAVHDEMIADGVAWRALKHAALTAMFDVSINREFAEAYWQRLGKQAPAKKPAKKPTDRQPRKATASKTTSASTGGTTRSRPAKKAAAPRGRRSSPAGG